MKQGSRTLIYAVAASAALVGALQPYPETARADDDRLASLDVQGFEPPDKGPVFEAVDDVQRVDASTGRDGLQTWIVQLDAEPLALFEGGTPDGAAQRLPATNPAALGEEKLDPDSPASRQYLDFLEQRQAELIGEIRARVGRTPDVGFRYRAAFNGFAMKLTADEAGRVAKMDGVRSVQPEFYRYLDTDRGPTFIGADDVWNGAFAAAGDATQGEGIVVGVLDSGLNLINSFPDGHPSFAEIGGDGYQVVNPLGSGTFLGWCDPADPNYDATLKCNDKVIGAYSFTADGTPDDENGHGTHVAGTAAGNVVNGVTIPGTTTTVDVAGVAPHANIVAYDVCEGRGCPGSAILAGLDQVVLDAGVVDVVNFSVGGASGDPWSDLDSQAFLGIREAGVFVATSAGNSGPDAATVGSPADAPWMTSVANQTHDRIVADASVSVTGPGSVPSGLQDLPAIEGTGPAFGGTLADGIDFESGNATGCTAFAGGRFSGAIALIQRGGCAFSDKVNNADSAGAVAVIVFNNVAGAGPFGMAGLESTAIPSVMVGNADGIAIRDWIVGNTGATASIDPDFSDTVLIPAAGDVMSISSSRGPNPATGDILKPDVSAPGSAIFAALGNAGTLGDTWGFLSGTSMASPHVAGSAALVRALHPTWTAAEIHSALVTRAEAAETIVKEDGSTPSDPFDRGGGRVSPPGAAGALLVMDETKADFDAADPGSGGDPTALNLPSLADGECFLGCSWTRTFTMVDDGMLPEGTPLSSSWTIDFDVPAGSVISASPSSFTLNAGEIQEVTFTADFSALANNEWAFGFANLNLDEFTYDPGTGEQTASGPGLYQRLPIAALNVLAKLPDPAAIETRRDAGSRLFAGLESDAITDLQIDSSGLVPATETGLELAEDPTPNPFDDFTQVGARAVTVPAGAYRLVAETASSESPDVDLYIVDLAAGEVVCASAQTGSDERCAVEEPAAGDYLLVVQNFEGSASQPDAITLFDAVVPAPSGADASLSAQGPTGAVAKGAPWDLRVFFELDPAQTATRWFGALALGSDAGQAGDLGTFPVEITRRADDVTKIADVDQAEVGDIIEYTLFVDTNLSGDTQSYEITDRLPVGLELVAGSVQVDRGSFSASGGQIEWTFDLDPPEIEYEMTTSAQDPTCDTGFGGYVNLADFGVPPADLGPPPGSPIDTAVYTAFTGGVPIDLYGVGYDGISFTDDGFLVGDFGNNYGGSPWVPQTLPDAALPNNLAAPLWQDLEIVNDPANGKGVSLANINGDEGILIEYDDVQPFGGDGSVTYDFEVLMWRVRDDAPGAFEIVFAYDNLSTLPATTTIGVENAAGDRATTLVNNADPASAITNGSMVCFDQVTVGTAQLTYQAEVVAEPPSADGHFTNEAEHATTEPGSQPETAFDRVKFFVPDELLRQSFEQFE
jgi:uncharacterized repeat protein (TIGR01451 family)